MAYRKEIEQVFKELDTSKNGLSSSDAASRLKADGYNELTEGKKTPLWKMFLENLKRQRQQEEIERQEMMNIESMMSSNRPKKDKGGNKHKTQQPDETQMSATGEFKGGKIN